MDKIIFLSPNVYNCVTGSHFIEIVRILDKKHVICMGGYIDFFSHIEEASKFWINKCIENEDN